MRFAVYVFALFLSVMTTARAEEPEAATIMNDCAPWDGATFTIKVGGNIHAWVYQSLSTLENKPEVLTYQITTETSSKTGSIVVCMQEGQPCPQKYGTISVKITAPGKAEGTVEWQEEDGTRQSHPFRATVEHRQVLCG